MINLNDPRMIGMGLTGVGLAFSFIGIMLFLDKGLIALGNIMFLTGIPMTIGVQPTIKFFSKKKHRLGSSFFLGGTLLILLSWTFIGLCVQGYGFWRLFAAFIPTVLQYARKVPYVSQFLNFPLVKNALNRIAPASGSQLPY